MLNSEMLSVIVPMIMAAQGEWLVDYDDVAISHAADVQPVTIPTRAVLGKLREVKIYDPASGVYFNLPVVDIGQLDDTKGQIGVYFVGDTLYLLDAARWPLSYVIRIFYYRRPNDLVLSASSGLVTDLTGGLTVASASTLFGATATLDFVQPRPPFSLVASDIPCTIVANLITPSVAVPEVSVGDWANVAGTSPVPMLPLEYHNILCQGVTMKVLEVSADAQGLQIAGAKYKQMTDSIKGHAANRIQGEAQIVSSRNRLF
jgi:hypothetical protein